MKYSYVMLVLILVLLLTWLILSLMVYALTDIVRLKDVMTHPLILGTMMIVGWVPAFIVFIDLYDDQL